MTALPRSYLFVPGDRPDRFDKAAAAGADCPILDLEDAVLPEAKAGARRSVRDWLAAGGRAALRVNGRETEWHRADMALAGMPGVLAILLPKAEDPGALAALAASLPTGLPLLPIIESAAGLLDARAIAALPNVQRLVFGSVDYSNDIGAAVEDDAMLSHARSAIVVASAAAGIGAPVDGVTLALDDAARLTADIALARRFGMTAKLCIHPRQVAVVNAGFEPSPAEIETARRIVAAARAAGARGAIRLDNRLIDKPILDRAERILARAGISRPE